MTSLELLRALNEALARGETAALVTVIRSREADRVGALALVRVGQPPLGHLGLGEQEGEVLAAATAALAAGRPQLLRYPEWGLEVFVDVQARPPDLIIVGAGHIAVPLCEIGALCGFRVTVIDDRPQYAHPGRFPKATRVIAADIRRTVRELPMDTNTFVVLVTRGHSLDVECLLEILDRPLAYIGMIGSQRRVSAVFSLLEREQGIPRAKLERVYAPIGLPIGAETPAEIAVAIMAEIINVRRGGQAISLAAARRRL